VSFEIERSVDEITMATMTTGDFIYINFYPELFSTTLTSTGVDRDQYAMRVDTMTFDKQTYQCPMLSAQIYDTQVSPILINPASPMIYSEVQFLPGQLSVVSNKTTTAPATQKLFNIRVSYRLKFFGRT
jgi:hypothetical protein